MTISELIEHLTAIKEKEGDLVVAARDKHGHVEDIDAVPYVDSDAIGFQRRLFVVIEP
jgi:DNA uptake protein ComE-like DNA-binding protein